METLKVTVVQTRIEWEQVNINLRLYEQLIMGIDNTDLIVFPEMFSTGFTMNPSNVSEQMDGITVQWMKQIASVKKAAVVGSIVIEEDGKYFNRCILANPDGNVFIYNKRHLFTMSGENLKYTAGKEKLVVEYRGWRICPLVCYDLRFPVWSRNTGDYDVLLYLANWPASRHNVWKSLLIARAIENQCYCIGVNRIGSDDEGIHYMGDSAFIDPKGKTIFLGDHEVVETFNLQYSDLLKFREKFPVLLDCDDFILKV